MARVHYQKILKLGRIRKEFSLCGKIPHKLKLLSTLDETKVTCTYCRLRLEKEK